MLTKKPKSVIPASGKALTILQEGDQVIGAIARTYLLRAAACDNVPETFNYVFDPKETQWKLVEQANENARADS
jgi:hypothetical protein